MGEVSDNLMSLAMVAAAIESNARRQPVSLRDSLSAALARAVEAEQREDVATVLTAWAARGRFARG